MPPSSISTIYIASEAWVKPFDQAAGFARVFKAISDVAYLLPAQAVAEGRRAAFEMAAFSHEGLTQDSRRI